MSIEPARREIFWFIEAYYNLKRKHLTLAYKSPVKFEIEALKNAA
jgi:transposase InsO family protein